MTDPLRALPSDDDSATADDLGLPEEWSASARESFEGVYNERPEMSAAEVGALWQACSLESAADALDAIARAAGYVAKGSTGQVVTHPAAVEARQARTQAATILARLTPAKTSGAGNSHRGRVAARARWGQAR